MRRRRGNKKGGRNGMGFRIRKFGGIVYMVKGGIRGVLVNNNNRKRVRGVEG
jgi:hypothetical protein